MRGALVSYDARPPIIHKPHIRPGDDFAAGNMGGLGQGQFPNFGFDALGVGTFRILHFIFLLPDLTFVGVALGIRILKFKYKFRDIKSGNCC